MLRLLAYFGKLIGTAVVGPSHHAGAASRQPVGGGALPVLLLLALTGFAWPVLALVAIGFIAIIITSRYRTSRG